MSRVSNSVSGKQSWGNSERDGIPCKSEKLGKTQSPNFREIVKYIIVY